MKTIYKSALALSLLATLAACGGGGGATSEIPPTTKPPAVTPNGPANTSAANLATWGASGATAEFENGVVRRNRTVTDGAGVQHRVYTDVIPGYGDARVTYVNSDGARVTALVDNTANRGTAPAGVYTGEIDAVWKAAGVTDRQSGTGRVSITLDTAKGEGYMDSIISGQNSGLEVMGDLKANGSQLTSNDLTVRFRDKDGYFVNDEKGNANAIAIQGNGTVGSIVGTFDSANASGGYTTGWSDHYTNGGK